MAERRAAPKVALEAIVAELIRDVQQLAARVDPDDATIQATLAALEVKAQALSGESSDEAGDA